MTLAETVAEKTSAIDFGRFPRVALCHQPTQIEPMVRLGENLGGPQLFIKRDDCTGLATGGNKTRKLEFLVGEALAQNADMLVTQGAVQSKPRSPDCRRCLSYRAEMPRGSGTSGAGIGLRTMRKLAMFSLISFSAQLLNIAHPDWT